MLCFSHGLKMIEESEIAPTVADNSPAGTQALLRDSEKNSEALAKILIQGERPLIMIVDDDPILQKALTLVLQRAYRVLTCSSGTEAVEKVNPEIYAIILDIKMQGKDGFQTFVEIKQKHPLIPITFHSAYQDLKDPYDVMNEFRPFGYVVKEGNHRLLMDTINSAVEYYRQIRATLHLVEELRSLNHHLEDRVRERTTTIKQQNTVLENQKSQLELQISMARNIQLALLPSSMPAMPGGRISFEYQPRLGVGGDFLDYYYEPGGSELGLFICDVSGNGVPAAFLASMVKMSLREWGRAIDDPAALLYEIHESMRGKLGANFLTASACHIDLQTGSLKYASAGHPPPLLVRKNGSIEFFRTRGGAIFEFLPVSFNNAPIQLEKGDKLILYTDGITEAHDASRKLLDESGFLDLVRSYPDESPEQLCRNIVRDILAYTGNREDNRPDDIAILAFEYEGLTGPRN